jgi:mRNA interferase RelE/StbE
MEKGHLFQYPSYPPCRRHWRQFWRWLQNPQEVNRQDTPVAFKIAISPRAQKYVKSLDKDDARAIKKHINELRQDPYTPRPQCDIIKEKGKRPPLYRLRVGSHRVEYFIEEDTIFISRVFHRSGGSDYR